MLADIDKETVDFQDNYDGKDREPTVLPRVSRTCWSTAPVVLRSAWPPTSRRTTWAKWSMLTLALIEDPDLTSSEQLIDYVPGPDFPTGGVMLGRSGARKAYLEGRGSVIIRSKTRVEEIEERPLRHCCR